AAVPSMCLPLFSHAAKSRTTCKPSMRYGSSAFAPSINSIAARSSSPFPPCSIVSASALRSALVSPFAYARSARRQRTPPPPGFFAQGLLRLTRRGARISRAQQNIRDSPGDLLSIRPPLLKPLQLRDRRFPISPRDRAIQIELRVRIELLDSRRHVVRGAEG